MGMTSPSTLSKQKTNTGPQRYLPIPEDTFRDTFRSVINLLIVNKYPSNGTRTQYEE